MKKKAIPAIVMLLLTCTLPSWSGVRDDRLPDLAEYLRKTGLPALYETELRTLCIEDGDLDACLALGALLGGRDLRKRALALLDSITWTDERWMLSTELVRADLAYRAGEYQEALEVLEAVIEELPAKDIMVEAVLLRAECQYRVGLADDAIMNLRSISPYVPGNRHAELALYLGLCEEEVGDLTEAERLVGEAEADGSSDAPLHLLRLKLKRGDLESFLVIADEIAAMRTGRAAREVCDLARDMAVVLPRAWHALIDPLVADTSFTATGCPEIASSIVQLAEAGEDMKGTCERLLARSNSREAAERLRYARAFSAADAALCDTLAALSRSVSVPGLRNRCLATCLASAAGDEGGALVAGLVPYLERMWDDLGASDRMELARLLAGFDKGQISRGYLMEIREGLEVGHDDMAILEVASAMVTAGDTSRALSEYRGLSKSPLPSEHTLEAERSAYRFEARIPAEEDIAGMVERIARQGLDPLELGDLLMEQLKDFERAAGVYRRVLAEPPEGTPVEEVKIKLAGALAMLALETNGQGLRAEALDLLSEVADTNIVAAGDIIEVLKVSTDWLRHERTRAFAIIQDVGRRDDLTSGELYEMAMLLYHLFSHRDGNVYAQCAVTLRRLSKEFPTSPEAPLGGFLAARLKFMAGDYVAALEAYRACREVWRNHAVTSLCDEGMGDCYLYSGGAGEARDHYGKVRAGARVAVKIAQCCELSGKPDSAIHYYSKALGHLSPPVVADPARLRYALLVCDRDGLETALAGLDSPFPAIRARLRQPRAMVAAYALGQRGYIDLAAGLLGAVSPGGDGSGCEALLLLSRLESGEEPKAKLARLGEGETRCSSIFGALRLLHERAYLACSSGPLETCVRERKRYQQRFPLDQRARFGFDVHRALLSYQEGRGEAATSIVDSLAATGRKHDALAYGLYRKGIHHMLEGDYALAKQAFGAVEREYADSELYFDALFKLGTACYMLEQYDSSAFYFEQTARSPKPSLVEDAYFNLGLALEEGGRPEQASDAFMKLAVRFPFSERFERALMRAAYTRQQAGLPDQAIPIYEDLLQYAEDPETAAEAMYWIGESFAEMGDALRAACEFLRVVRLFPGGGPWTGTAAYRAGLECEKAGLVDHALIVYRENVSSFGTGTDWGRASQERLDELQREPAGGLGPQEPDEGTENVSEPVGRRGENPTGR